MVSMLREVDEFGVPLDADAERIELLAHDELVVVLAEDEDERVGRDGAADVAERHMRHAASLCPHSGAGALLAELERALDDAELGVDFQRACLHAKRPALHGRPRVAVDDLNAHAAPYELVGEHK